MPAKKKTTRRKRVTKKKAGKKAAARKAAKPAAKASSKGFVVLLDDDEPAKKAPAKKSGPKKSGRKAPPSEGFVVLLDDEPSAGDDGRLRLERECALDGVARLKDRLSALLDTGQGIVIDAADVKSVDTATMQLLHAFAVATDRRHLELNFAGKSEAFEKAATRLGLGARLGEK